jgi:hypothetical protein
MLSRVRQLAFSLHCCTLLERTHPSSSIVSRIKTTSLQS